MASDWYLTITDGTTSCSFENGAGGATSYKVADDSWAPAVAGLRRSQLGGQGPYDDVTEDLSITVTGATRAAALSNLATLARLLEQAERWQLGENVSPVLIKYSPKGGTVSSDTNPLQAVILGRADGDETSGLTLPVTFDDLEFNAYIVRARLRFRRRGLWLLGTTSNASSTQITAQGVMNVTGLTSHAQPSPCHLKVASFHDASPLNLDDSPPIMLLAGTATDLQIAQAEVGTATMYTAVNGTAQYASGGTVLRYTPSDTNENVSGAVSLSSMTSTARQFAFFAAIRNNSASVTFQLRVGATVDVAAGSKVASAFTPKVLLDTTHTRPRFVPLGIASTLRTLTGFRLYITASSTSGSPTLDIDYVVCLALDKLHSRAFQLVGVGSASAFASWTHNWNLIIDPRPLTHRNPEVYRLESLTADVDPYGGLGDIYPVSGPTGLAALLMAKHTNTSWTVFDNTSDLTLTVTRYAGYLVPE